MKYFVRLKKKKTDKIIVNIIEYLSLNYVLV